MTSISLLDFLRQGVFGPYTPAPRCSPEDVFQALGQPEEAYAPSDLDRAYTAGDEHCFPLIAAYGDVEFHFASSSELATLFVDSFSGRRGLPQGGPLTLTEADALRAGTTLAQFEQAAAQLGIGIRSIRPYSPLCLRGADRRRRGGRLRTRRPGRAGVGAFVEVVLLDAETLKNPSSRP